MRIGDRVEIIDRGYLYSSYKKWIMKYGEKYLKNWEYENNDCSYVDSYKIVAKGKHFITKEMLYLIQNEDNNRVYIFEKKGIEKVNKKGLFGVFKR